MKKLIVFFMAMSICIYSKNYEIRDAHGKKHTYKKSFERIISLYPAHTEVLKDLGAEGRIVGAVRGRDEEMIPGVTEFRLGDSVEKFIALNPDLVLVRPLVESKYAKLIEILRSQGVEVISLHPKTASELYGYWEGLGELSGREKEAGIYEATFEARKKKLMGRSSRGIRVFFEARNSRNLYTSAPDSIASFVLETAGVENIFQGKQGRAGSSLISVKYEELLMEGADIDLYIAQAGTMNPRSLADIEGQRGAKYIKAIRDGRVLIIDESLMSRPTARLLDAVEDIVDYIDRMKEIKNP